jgi:hypothetical protein
LMYIPGFNPYLAGDFSQQMGIAPQQTFQPVSAPATNGVDLSYQPNVAGGIQFRTVPVPESERLATMPQGGFQMGGYGETFEEPHLQYLAIGPEDDPFYVGKRNDVLGLDPRTNRGNSAGFVPITEGSQYKLVNNATGEVISSGAGEQAFRDALTQAQALSGVDGKKANWSIMTAGPDGQFRQVAADTPDKGALGTIADLALPIAGSLLLPGVGGFLGGALGTGLGAAGGSLTSSILQGRDFGDALLRAGLSGITAGGLSSLSGTPLTGATSSKLSSTVGSAASSKLGSTAAQTISAPFRDATGALVLTGSGAGGSALGGGLTAALAGMGGGLGGNLANQVFQQPGSTPQSTFNQADPNMNEIILSGSRPAAGGGIPVGGVLAGTAPFLQPGGGGGAPATEGNDILVEAQRQAARNSAADDFLKIAGPTAAIGGGALAATSGAQTPTDAKKPSTLEQIEKYLGLGGGALAILGDLFGGRGRNNTNRLVPGGLASGQLNPVFSGGLGAPTLAGAAGNFAPRDVDVDWKRYGYGPEQSFFNYAPQARPNTSTAFTGYAEGGEVMGGVPMDSYAVRGPGTGRSDEIPALLSDGEYVIDAETVALLGDGSTEAGAERLDQFRVNLRKHKGQQLAKGGFSPDAKAPEHYLKGGRT